MIDDATTAKQLLDYLEQNQLNEIEPHWGEWVRRKALEKIEFFDIEN